MSLRSSKLRLFWVTVQRWAVRNQLKCFIITLNLDLHHNTKAIILFSLVWIRVQYLPPLSIFKWFNLSIRSEQLQGSYFELSGLKNTGIFSNRRHPRIVEICTLCYTIIVVYLFLDAMSYERMSKNFYLWTNGSSYFKITNFVWEINSWQSLCNIL